MRSLAILGVTAAAVGLLAQAASANELPASITNLRSTTVISAPSATALGGTAALAAIRDKVGGSATFGYRGPRDAVVMMTPGQSFTNARVNSVQALAK